MQYEIKWSFSSMSFDSIWEKIKRDLMGKVLPAAKERADDILRYIKEGHSDYIKRYWHFGNEKRFYLIFNGLFFKEPAEKSRGLNNLNCRPLDNNLVWAFLEWRCNFNTLVLQCLWINRL